MLAWPFFLTPWLVRWIPLSLSQCVVLEPLSLKQWDCFFSWELLSPLVLHTSLMMSHMDPKNLDPLMKLSSNKAAMTR